MKNPLGAGQSGSEENAALASIYYAPKQAVESNRRSAIISHFWCSGATVTRMEVGKSTT